MVCMEHPFRHGGFQQPSLHVASGFQNGSCGTLTLDIYGAGVVELMAGPGSG